MPYKSRTTLVAGLALAVLLSVGCGSGDDLGKRIEHRALHSVELLSWSEQEDGRIMASLQVAGPVHSDLDRFTFEIVLYSDDDSIIKSKWVTLDISEMERGTPRNEFLFLEVDGERPAALAIDVHETPSAEVIPRLPELGPTP